MTIGKRCFDKKALKIGELHLELGKFNQKKLPPLVAGLTPQGNYSHIRFGDINPSDSASVAAAFPMSTRNSGDLRAECRKLQQHLDAACRAGSREVQSLVRDVALARKKLKECLIVPFDASHDRTTRFPASRSVAAIEDWDRETTGRGHRS